MNTLLTATPGQTVGPFFAYALPFERGNELVPPGSPNAIQLSGVVSDGDGEPVPDALLEIWQADADGVIPNSTGSLRRDGWTFTGWGRASTDDDGRYSFSTVVPGASGPGRHRSSTSSCSPVDCSIDCSPGRTSRASGWRTIRCWPRCRPNVATP